MHPHLHTEENIECAEVMNALEECHARGFLYKSLGNCNDAKRKVSDCLYAARMKRLDNNRAAARTKKEEYQRRVDELHKSLSLDNYEYHYGTVAFLHDMRSGMGFHSMARPRFGIIVTRRGVYGLGSSRWENARHNGHPW
ncbi:UPF0287-domain-containing protein [Sodiomyces alkalinus F11]|uniref:COX assembly mitochondrial protein n=1 Tax=Sodiomyces alkalinus (strain CBS 110278 / VKM F-3762 / F11) TaxID=1314773 RepID=A0A3N2PZ30_SODAK|nr:UPF0287-domain-containing protein [Sodiomyces alkalinus F11]ROT39781.1 UPF0287-domain-containing protein [Sodiomyces alkalinus F11]